jgi:hypothetical protein
MAQIINHCPRCGDVVQYAIARGGGTCMVNPDDTPHNCGQNGSPVIRAQTDAVKPTPTPDQIPALMVSPAISAPETVIRHINELPDSFEQGTPGKGGVVKVYVNFGDPADAENRIREALRLRDLANTLVNYPTAGHQAGTT